VDFQNERAPGERGAGGLTATGETHDITASLDDAPGAIHYSRGCGKFDAYPEQRTAVDFRAFAQAVLSDRSTAKGLTWISGPFAPNSDGRHHRCGDGALPRGFLVFDLDGSTPPGFAELCMDFAAYRGFGYTTASHTTENPHARFILELSRPVDRAESIRLGTALQRQIEARLGPGAVQLDASVYRGEQPIYGPLFGAETMHYRSDPVQVDQILKDAPPLKERPGRAERASAIASRDPVVRVLADRGMVKRDHDGDGKLLITCPYEDSHTEPGVGNATVYLMPCFGGVKFGKFSCLHAHCEGRQQGDYLIALGLDPKEVWREQGGGAGPYDDLPPVESYGEAVAKCIEDTKTPVGGEARPGNGSAPEGFLGGEEWPEPQPLPEGLPPVTAFDTAMLPDTLKPWATDICERVQCPPDFVAVAIMAGLGSIIGRKLGIRPQARTDWTVAPNQWALVVGRPGVLKSPAMEAALVSLITSSARKYSCWFGRMLSKPLAHFLIGPSPFKWMGIELIIEVRISNGYS
jgi:hypothetical protein